MKFRSLFTIVLCFWVGGPVFATVQTRSQLQTGITNGITSNGHGAITGAILNSVLTNMTASFCLPDGTGCPSGANSPVAYGAKCDGSTDDTTALTAWLAAITAGSSVVIPGVCVFTSPLSFPIVNNVSVTGGTLEYAGASTTGNLITIGSTVTGCSVTGWRILNLTVVSTTVMTSGDGLRLNDMCGSNLQSPVIGGFNNGAADTHFYNGIHFNGGNQVYVTGVLFSAGAGAAAVVNGDAGLQFSDLRIQGGGLIFGAAVGLDIAGNVGGGSFDNIDILENGANILVSRDQVNVGNNQLFFGPLLAVDVTNSIQYPSASQIGIEFSDPGSSFAVATFTGTWIASAHKQCVKFDNTITSWNITFTGGQILNCGLSSIPGTVDNESSGDQISFVGTKFSDPVSATGAPYIYNIGGGNTIYINAVFFEGNTNGFYTGSVSGLYNDFFGNNYLTNALDIIDTGTSDVSTLALNATNDTNGLNIKMTGNGVTTPTKYIRVLNGGFDIVNSAYNLTLLHLSDAGQLSIPYSPIINAAPPAISSCGTSPSVTAGSNNSAGQFLVGGSSPTSCTLTFANAYPTTAYCTVTPSSSGGAAISGGYYISAQSASGFTLTLGTGTSNPFFQYACSGN